MVAGPVLAIVMFDVGLMVVVGAVLLAGGPAGGVAVAVFTTVPLPAAVPVTFNVTEPPIGNRSEVRPGAGKNRTRNGVGHVATPHELGHGTPGTAKFATARSVKSVPFAVLGPGFVTTTV